MGNARRNAGRVVSWSTALPYPMISGARDIGHRQTGIVSGARAAPVGSLPTRTSPPFLTAEGHADHQSVCTTVQDIEAALGRLMQRVLTRRHRACACARGLCAGFKPSGRWNRAFAPSFGTQHPRDAIIVGTRRSPQGPRLFPRQQGHPSNMGEQLRGVQSIWHARSDWRLRLLARTAR